MGTRRVRVLIAATLGVLAAASVTWAVKGPYRSARFAHKAHLHKALLDPRSAAAHDECMSCHATEQRDRETGRLSNTTFGNCKDCHVREKELVKVEVQASVVRSQLGGFNHTAHESQLCVDCHSYEASTDTFTLQRDILRATCKACHDVHDTEKPWHRGEGANACSSCHFTDKITLLTPARRGSFDHRTHLPRSPRREDCLACHAGLTESQDLRSGVTGMRAEACARCHVVAPGAEPIAWKTQVEAKSRFFTEFRHDAHVRTMDCASCHKLEASGAFTYAAAGLPDYEGCVSCHYHRDWRVQDHGAPIQCGKCHEPDSPAIRLVEVKKQDLGPVRFGKVDHPFVSPADLAAIPQGQDCARCHVRPREDMASRIQVQPFSHKAHLGEARAKEAARGVMPTSETCLACHGALRSAATPGESKAFDLVRDCASCHRGDPAVAVPAARTVKVPRFSHESHLASQSARIKGCDSCHAYDGAKDRMVTPPEVLDCTRCHNHRDNADVTGQDLDKCILCHTGDSLFRSGLHVEVGFERLAATDLSAQHHDQTTRQCAQCHAPDGGFELKRRAVKAVDHKNDPHRGLSMDSCGQCHVKLKKDG